VFSRTFWNLKNSGKWRFISYFDYSLYIRSCGAKSASSIIHPAGSLTEMYTYTLVHALLASISVDVCVPFLLTWFTLLLLIFAKDDNVQSSWKQMIISFYFTRIYIIFIFVFIHFCDIYLLILFDNYDMNPTLLDYLKFTRISNLLYV